MRKFHPDNEPDRGIRFNWSMTTDTLSHHDLTGRITWLWVRHPFDDPAKYVGSYPWDWIEPRDHKRVREAISKAGNGTVVVCKYLLKASLYGGKLWQVETVWAPCTTPGSPIVGISRTLAALPKLTKAEQTLLKLLGSKEKSATQALQRKKSTTLRSAKWRLSRKLGISATDLVAFCTEYADIF
jgi:hypothetical protein